MKTTTYIFLALLISSCASTTAPIARVHQEHLDAWVNMPIEALETHTWFLTRPKVKTITSSGIEIWHYVDGIEATNCKSSATLRHSRNSFLPSSKYNEFTSCLSGSIVCNSLFFIKDGYVQEYAVTGRCYTSDAHLPQDRYLKLRGG